MADNAPWEKYAGGATATEDGPWAKYAPSKDAPDDLQQRTLAKSRATTTGLIPPSAPPNPLSRFSEVTTGVAHPIDQAISEAAAFAAHPGRTLWDATKQGAKGLLIDLPNAVLRHPIDTAVGLTGGRQFAEDAQAHRWGSAAADIAAGATNVALLGHGAGIDEAAATWLNKMGPSVENAAKLYDRAVIPNAAKAEAKEAVRDSFTRASKYLGQQTKGIAMEGSEGAVMRGARMARAAEKQIWDSAVQPAINTYQDVPNPTRMVAAEIRAGYTDLDQFTAAGKRAIRAGDQFAQAFDREDLTVKQVSDMVTQLNNDKAVARFYDMSPSEQTQALRADPSLRGKVIAVDALRGSLFDTIDRVGGEELGTQFREARKDWGALKTVETTLRDTSVPTDPGLITRSANTIRSLWRGDVAGMAARQTLAQSQNPNSLIARSFNMLGKTAGAPTPFLQPPPVTADALLPAAAKGQQSLTLMPPPTPSVQGPLFDLSQTPPTALEFSNQKLRGISNAANQPLGILENPVATSAEKAEARGALESLSPAVKIVNREFERLGIPRPSNLPANKASMIETAIKGPRYKSLALDEQRDYMRSLGEKKALVSPPEKPSKMAGPRETALSEAENATKGNVVTARDAEITRLKDLIRQARSTGAEPSQIETLVNMLSTQVELQAEDIQRQGRSLLSKKSLAPPPK